MTERHACVCGPPTKTSAVLTALRRLEVHRQQVFAGRFVLA
ncbi:hypothetical protein ACWGJB_45105 [Streptomyces sp. NPDC054813]